MMNISEDQVQMPRLIEATLSVLLLEDEVYYGKLIRRTLRTPDSQFDVTWVTNLAMALELIEEEDFDVVISDLELPDATNLDALMAIRSADAEVPIVILTGHSEATIGLEAIRGGADDFIIKERVSADSLVRSIRYAVERKRCEELRMRLEAIKDFTGMLAHDLRAPLMGSARVLECLEDAAVSPQDKAELTHHLRESNQQLLNLVTQLIEIYRLEMAPPAVSTRPITVQPSLDCALRSLNGVVQVKALEVQQQIDSGLPPVFADRSSLERMLTNILDNACKYSPDNSTITVRATAIEDGAKVRLDVIDHGPGISEETQHALFKRFWYGTPGKAYSSSGGLGLYLCDKLATAQGGTITYETSESGTKFSVILRAANK